MASPIDNEFSTRSGVFTAISPKISMQLNRFGEYDYVVTEPLTGEELEQVGRLDGLRHADEDQIAGALFATDDTVRYDPVIGYYRSLYCGHVSEGEYRANGSSGGMATWILTELIRRREIDGVVCVVHTPHGEALYEYAVLRSEADIIRSAKSRYYPVEMSAALAAIKETPGSYAVVGIPSFVSDLRRLQQIDDTLRERVKYTVGLLCGHQKSAKYGESIAFEAGIRPGNTSAIDFRYKSGEGLASAYVTEVHGTDAGLPTRKVLPAEHSYTADWSAGMLKTNFSDFVDDCFGETADITLGDAWLPQYIADSWGTNVVVVRNPRLAEIIAQASSEGRLALDPVTADVVRASQPGLIRHYRAELPYRLWKFSDRAIVKRVQPSSDLAVLRRAVQSLRLQIAKQSRVAYREAEERSDWSYFVKKMDPLMSRYRLVYRLIRARELGARGVAQRIKGRFRRQPVQ